MKAISKSTSNEGRGILIKSLNKQLKQFWIWYEVSTDLRLILFQELHALAIEQLPGVEDEEEEDEELEPRTILSQI